jgi:signal transduction histidine kinase
MTTDLCRIIVVEKLPKFRYALEACIGKINRQTYINYQLICHDNCNPTVIKNHVLNHNFDICIIDLDYFNLNLPVLSEDLARAIARFNSILPSPSNSLIVLTEDYATGIKAVEAGATDYLNKTELTTSSLERSLRLTYINSQLKQHQDRVNQIEPQKQAEIELRCQELTRSNAELEQFAYIISHDLQAPLHTITNYARLLEFCVRELDEKANKYLNYIVDSATRMKTQIEDLLEYSRLGFNCSTSDC